MVLRFVTYALPIMACGLGVSVHLPAVDLCLLIVSLCALREDRVSVVTAVIIWASFIQSAVLFDSWMLLFSVYALIAAALQWLRLHIAWRRWSIALPLVLVGYGVGYGLLYLSRAWSMP